MSERNGVEIMHKICFFVPATHVEQVKQAMFQAGAGRYENYDCCAWQTAGQGQFRPLDGSNPFIGSEGNIERVEEFKVEMICSDDSLNNAIEALRAAHPYEEPAFEAWEIRTFPSR